MEKRIYERDDDYILEILEQQEEKLLENICEKIPDEIEYDFSKLLAIINTIEKIYKSGK
jgi:predicted house-cleaning noncanonical NTP pyrophosphatase (MazG superfamily)